MKQKHRYLTRAAMFGEGAKGFHIQEYKILRLVEGGGEVETGITELATKASHKDPWVIRYYFGETEYPGPGPAILAYEATL